MLSMTDKHIQQLEIFHLENKITQEELDIKKFLTSQENETTISKRLHR